MHVDHILVTRGAEETEALALTDWSRRDLAERVSDIAERRIEFIGDDGQLLSIVEALSAIKAGGAS